MSVLSLKKLSMRFGGLAAVSDVSCAVEAGQIYSIIGPNGAGKTTVFNLVTGIYEPTAGEVEFEGRRLQRPLTWRVISFWLLVGISTGLASMLVAANLDGLWTASIKHNFNGDIAKFSYGAAWRDAIDYLQGITPEALAPERKQLVIGALIMGTLLGAAGAYVVWNRARSTPDVIAKAGIARTFQNIRLFQNMTALDNVLVGMDRGMRGGIFGMALRTPRICRDEELARTRAMELLKFVALEHRALHLAKNLPYGEQRRLEIARALATRPRLILLDEPAAGMNPTESADLTELIRRIRGQGVTVLLIEHHMRVVMGISDRISVLEYGRKIAEGTPAEIRANPVVIQAYLGSEEVH